MVSKKRVLAQLDKWVTDFESIKMADMSNLRSEDTGLAMVIWVQSKSGKEKHGPKIKVQKSYGNKIQPSQWFSMTIEDSPKTIGSVGDIKSKDIDQVALFIRTNKKALLDHWNLKLSTPQFLKKLNKI